MTKGLVIGKFWPVHSGHLKLIEFARTQVDQLFVVVCDGGEDVPARTRMQWIADALGGEDGKGDVLIGLIPSFPDLSTPDATSEAWAFAVKTRYGYSWDKVFLGSDYPAENRFAEFLGAERVNLERDHISGTAVRANPQAYWEHLTAPVRGWYAKRIVILGSESTGTTTLARGLAEALGTVWVPEYGRTYTEGRGLTQQWTTDEFVHIADQQNRMEDALAQKSNGILICDTDAFATEVWHERYVGTQMPSRDQHRASLYIITDYYDVEFGDDGLRDGESLRPWMQGLFAVRLQEAKKNYLFVTGSPTHRLYRAVDEVVRLT